MYRCLTAWLCFGVIGLTACQPNMSEHEQTSQQPQKTEPQPSSSATSKPHYHLHIASANNLKIALPMIVDEFKQLNPDVEVTYTFANTQTIYADVKSYDKRYDIILADNQATPAKLYSEKPKSSTYGKPFTYTRGELVVYSKKYDMNLSPTAMFDEYLMDSKPFSIVVGDMDDLSYGIATKAWFVNQNLYPKIENHLLEMDDLSQTIDMVYHEQADFAIASLGQVLNDTQVLTVKNASKNITNQKSYAILPKNSYPAIYQDGIVLQESKVSQDFVKYLQSSKSQEILNEAGFLPICQTSNLLPACK